jgi:molybdenum-dependent DNA-binding transcriptional regulator ModE
MTINGMGYKYIQWSVDSIDWQEPSPQTIVRRVTGGTQSGSILLFHNDLANTAEALPEIISTLKSRGFEIVPVSELIFRENYEIDHTGKQVFVGSSEAQIHTVGTQANAAFEVLLENLSMEEIMSLEHGMSPELMRRLNNVLTREQISAVTALSDSELQAAWGMLVQAKATSGSAVLEREDGGNESGIAGINLEDFDKIFPADVNQSVLEQILANAQENIPVLEQTQPPQTQELPELESSK